MDYTLRELESFHAVAEELSFTRAARRLHLAQPPLSRHIRVLEDKLGVTLFDRTNRTVVLTPPGSLFYEQTRMVLFQLRRAEDAVRRHGRGELGSLRIGVVTAVVGPGLLEVLRKFRDIQPTVRLEIRDDTPQALLAQIASGALDGGFIGVQPRLRAKGIEVTRWLAEPLLAYLPFGHPLAKAKECSLKELARETFVAVERSVAPAFSEFVQELCRDAGFRPRIVQESARAQAVAVMAASGSGVALLPASFKAWLGDQAPTVSLKKVRPITHVFARRSGPTDASLAAFLKILRDAE